MTQPKLTKAQRKALVMLQEAEQREEPVIHYNGGKYPVNVSTSGWLVFHGYALYVHIGKLNFEYRLTPAGRKLAR